MSDKPYTFDESPEPSSSPDSISSSNMSSSSNIRSDALYGANSDRQGNADTQPQTASQGEQNNSALNKPQYKTKVKTPKPYCRLVIIIRQFKSILIVLQ